MNYDTLVSKVLAKGCKLDWTENQFDEKYENHKSMIDIVSKCGHTTCVQFSNFLYKDTGIICKSCTYKNDKNNKVNIPIDTHAQEYSVLKAFQIYCKDLHFNILKEGCLADCAIKPINETSDVWLPIQVKTTQSLKHGVYHFTINNHYENMFILLFCIEEQRIWLINGNIVNISDISIGHYKSIYSRYEYGSVDIATTLISVYNEYKSFTKSLAILNVPISDQQKQAHEYNRFREDIFPMLRFDYPDGSNTVFDCIINNVFKIQDKVITMYYKNKIKRETPSYIVRFKRARTYANIAYKLGDNDFYYFHLPDHKGAFIIPEKQLYDHGFISKAHARKRILL